MAKNIISAGFQFPGNLATFVALNSKQSLLDGDLIIFRPDIQLFREVSYTAPTFQGRPSFTDDASFRVKDAASHWKQQITLALMAGKTVVLFLPELTRVFVDSGTRSYEGSGRNRIITRNVDGFDNYQMLPSFCDEITPAEGTQMKLNSAITYLKPYWDEFGTASAYKVLLRGLKCKPLITTASGDFPVACAFTVRGGTGTCIALPPLVQYDRSANRQWSKADQSFGHRLLKALMALDAAIRAGAVRTPPPQWASGEAYGLAREREIRKELLGIDGDIEHSLQRKGQLAQELAEEGKLRDLLYETGRALETAILIALRVLGFSAEPLKEGQSEFDAVFVSPEGRFIGEAEGKDTKAINIDKLRQLEMNILEDFERVGITEHAHGVLFLRVTRQDCFNWHNRFISVDQREGRHLCRCLDCCIH